MKALALSLLVLGCIRCSATEATNIIAVGEWSAPVSFNDHSIRGRLLLLDGNEPAYGGPTDESNMMMFIELQNMAIGGSLRVYYDATGLSCDLADLKGKVVPRPEGGAWSGRGPFRHWVVIPYNSTIRLFVNSGRKSPLLIPQSGEPGVYWRLPLGDTNVYFLSGTLAISVPTNSTLTVTPPESMGYHDYADWSGTLVLPKMKVSTDKLKKGLKN